MHLPDSSLRLRLRLLLLLSIDLLNRDGQFPTERNLLGQERPIDACLC